MAVAPGTERRCKRCGMALVYLEGQSGPDHCMPAQKVRGVYRREGDRVVKIAVPPGADEIFVNHFETCPHAAEFSRSSKGSRTTKPPAKKAGAQPLTLFDPVVAMRLREIGIHESMTGADPRWRDAAKVALHECASATPYLIVDNVWQFLDEKFHTYDNRSMGPIMRWGAGEGKEVRWLEKTGWPHVHSARTTSHGDLRPIWRSLIYKGFQPDDGGEAFFKTLRDRGRRRRGDR